jgi:multiple sugar transport system substrate-binding protein
MTAQRMNRRQFLQLLYLASGSSVLAACAPQATAQPTAPPQPTPTAPPDLGLEVGVGGTATGVPYQKKDWIYNLTEPVNLVQWDWHPPRQPWFEKKAKEYNQMYPQVTIDLTVIPVGVHGTDYQTKANLAVPAGEGPDILQNGPLTSQQLSEGWAEALPETMFDYGFLQDKWLNTKIWQQPDGKYYQIPWGFMSAMIYVNQQLWDGAGLTESDVPATWDDMLTVSKKLTKYDGAGNLDVSGFAFNGWLFGMLALDMAYEQGRYLYTADGRKSQVDSPEALKSLQTLQKFYDEKINAPIFLNGDEAFQTNKAAMMYIWTFYTGVLESAFPDIKFFTFRKPSFTGDPLPSLGRSAAEMSFVINRFRPEQNRNIAMDFTHWLHSSEDNLIELALLHGIAPAYTGLTANPRVVADKNLAALTAALETSVFPGDFANELAGAVIGIGQNIIAGTAPEQSLQEAQQAIDQILEATPAWTVERQYKHADKMLPDQP